MTLLLICCLFDTYYQHNNSSGKKTGALRGMHEILREMHYREFCEAKIEKTAGYLPDSFSVFVLWYALEAEQCNIEVLCVEDKIQFSLQVNRTIAEIDSQLRGHTDTGNG